MPLPFLGTGPSLSPEELWATAFNELSQRMKRYFIRSEPHQRALAFVQGLMRPAFSRRDTNQWGFNDSTAARLAASKTARWASFFPIASSRGHTLLDRELYVPKSWTNDQERCREAHVPPEVTFATKPELALRMLERTLESGPLSVAEIRRLFFCLVGKPSLTFAYHLTWSFWRRVHQALARLCHYKCRNTLASHLQL